MPVHKYGIQAKHQRPDLVKEIALELKADRFKRKSGVANPPEVYIEESPSSSREPNWLRVWVVWEKWAGVPEIQRSGVILDAFAKAGLKEETQRITVAMGLTHEEADALGLSQ